MSPHLRLSLTLLTASLMAYSGHADEPDPAVKIVPDVAYLGPDREEKGDLYLPADSKPEERRPAILIIHGGGWKGGDKGAKREINFGTNFVRRGYVGFSINYVLASEGKPTWPRNLQDCKAAVRWLRRNADRLGIDPERIGVIGGSAGGHLAAMIGVTGPDAGLDPGGLDSDISCRVQAAVDFYGPADLEVERRDHVMLSRDVAGSKPTWWLASPVNHTTPDDPPMLVVHGTKDTTVSVDQSYRMAAALKRSGIPHELVIIPNAPHSFHLQPKQRDLRSLVIGFFDRHLKRPQADSGRREIPLLTGQSNMAGRAPTEAPVENRLLLKQSDDAPQVWPFGEGGQVKMIYDARQRPQSVYLNGKLHIVFNGGGRTRESKNSKRKSEARSIAITYDPSSRKFSEMITLGEEFSSDHHDGPVIWADREEKLHVFYGWHHDRGTHLVSREHRSIGSSLDDWSEGSSPASKMSYQWMSRIYDDKQLVFYRTDGHYSSWTYRITDDNGTTWEGPENDLLDLDMHRGMDTDWSTYTAKEISKDGNYLHVGFVAYDDYKRPRSPEEIASGKLDKTRLHNPLYDNRVPSNYKYNLYYVKIDLRTHEVVNDQGEALQTPVDRATANNKCMIWDTKWRGGGIIPTIRVDENDKVSFLHNLSDVAHEKSLSYHYVRQEHGEWKHTRIAHSNHHWNSGCIAESADGVLHAYLLTGEGYLKVEGDMDRYGGGAIEEWISTDNGDRWEMNRDLTPDRALYPGWKYNNIQAIKKPDGTVVDGMLLFYGWQDPKAPKARAFLLHE